MSVVSLLLVGLTLTANGLQICDVADLVELPSILQQFFYYKQNVSFTIKPAISANVLLWAGFNTFSLLQQKLSHKEILIKLKLFLSK